MAKRVLILVEGSRTGLLSLEAAQRLGLHPITLTADSSQHDYIAAERVEAIHVDKANLDASIGECSRLLRPMNCRYHLRQGVGPCISGQALPVFRSTRTESYID